MKPLAINTNATTLPPEWAHQYAVLLTWPHKKTDWEPILSEVEPLYMQLAKEILKRENLIISCGDFEKVDELERLLKAYAIHGFELFVYPAASDDTWARDHGPITIFNNEQQTLLDFEFNAWGGKFPYIKDNLINSELIKYAALADYSYIKSSIVLEGGSIESNGHGVILTTSECLLTPSRNPTLDKTQLEQELKNQLGCNDILWLDHGYLSGDDTDSHIDTLARFCAPDLICYVKCDDTNDEHHEALKEMENQLRSFKQLNGNPYRLKALPMASAIFDEGERLPATYANFLIINEAVLVPIYNVKEDDAALAVLKECFPNREIIPINCCPLIKQHGSLHCITMQIPCISIPTPSITTQPTQSSTKEVQGSSSN